MESITNSNDDSGVLIKQSAINYAGESSLWMERAVGSWVKLHEILKLCELGWFVELRLSPDSVEYYGIEQEGSETVISLWLKQGINLNHTVYFDMFDSEDKIIYAHL